MTCGIHLYIEKRNRKLNTIWYPCSFHGEFTDIAYGMFAALNNVRNYWNIKPLENRGIPNDLGPLDFDAYYQKIVTEVVDEEHECSIDDITEDDDYGEWLGLLNYMKAIESNGIYDVRAIFWFED